MSECSFFADAQHPSRCLGGALARRAQPCILALGALCLTAAAPPSATFAGIYEIRQMEMAGGLELRQDGHFRYALSYGALDEQAQGDWRVEGKSIRLTSRPMPKAPSFELVRDEAAPVGELYLKLEDPGFDWGHSLQALAMSDMKKAFEIEAGEDGRVDLGGKSVIAISPLVPVYGPTRETFNLSSDRGHRLLFRFHPNDLGKAAFDDEPVKIGPDGLVMNRYDSEIRFIRVRP